MHVMTVLTSQYRVLSSTRRVTQEDLWLQRRIIVLENPTRSVDEAEQFGNLYACLRDDEAHMDPSPG